MRTSSIFLLSLLALTGRAQLPVVPLQTTPAASAPVVLPQLTNLYFHFIYNQSIFTNSSGIVTNWVDLVAGRRWTNYSNSNGGPTWTPNGVFFAGTNNVFLAASNNASDTIQWSNRCAMAWISGTVDASSVGVVFGVYLGTSSGSGFDVNYNTEAWDEVDSGGSHTALSSAQTYRTNDVIFGPDYKWYTNGVLSTTGVNLGNNTFNVFGGAGGSSKWYKGYVFEAIGWTNIAATGFTAGEIAQIHQYSTNHYGGIP